MFVGSFPLDDEGEFESDTLAAMTALQEAGVTRVLIDLTNNPGKLSAKFHGVYLSSSPAASAFCQAAMSAWVYSYTRCSLVQTLDMRELYSG